MSSRQLITASAQSAITPGSCLLSGSHTQMSKHSSGSKDGVIQAVQDANAISQLSASSNHDDKDAAAEPDDADDADEQDNDFLEEDLPEFPENEVTVDILESSMVAASQTWDADEGMLVPPRNPVDRRLSISSLDQDTHSMEVNLLAHYLDTEDTHLSTNSHSDLKSLIKRFLRLSAITRQFKRRQQAAPPARAESVESVSSSVYSLAYGQPDWLASALTARQRRSSYFLSRASTVIINDEGSGDEDADNDASISNCKQKGWVICIETALDFTALDFTALTRTVNHVINMSFTFS